MIKVCYPFVGDSIGGSHISAVTLIKSIQETRTDIKPHVLVFCPDELFKEFLMKSNITFDDIDIKLSRFSKFSIFIDIFRSFFKLIKYINKAEIDIVHTNDLRINLIFLVVCKFTRVKHLWHQRTSMPRSTLGKRIFLLSDKLVTVSDYILNQIGGLASKGQLSRVYNPIDSYTATNEELFERVNSFKKRPSVVAFIANVTAQKKAEVFVDMAKIAILKKLSNLEFIMIGRTNETIRNQIQILKDQETLDDSFKIIGFRDDVDQYLAKVDFLIVPAEGDGFGRTLIESMKAGVIVIAYESGGHKEIIKNNLNGILVKNLKAQDFMDSLLEIINNENLYQSLLFNAHKQSKSVCTVEQHTKDICLIYANMLKDLKVNLGNA